MEHVHYQWGSTPLPLKKSIFSDQILKIIKMSWHVSIKQNKVYGSRKYSMGCIDIYISTPATFTYSLLLLLTSTWYMTHWGWNNKTHAILGEIEGVKFKGQVSLLCTTFCVPSVYLMSGLRLLSGEASVVPDPDKPFIP